LIATMFRRAAIVVVLGGRDLELVSQSLQLRRNRMIVLHNAVPDPLPDLNRNRSGKPCHVLFLGYLSARKGVPDLEGLSHGLAVVTAPVGAHLEVIEPDVSGILVPPGDVAALADALISVVEDETLRHRLARGAWDRFLEAFDVRRYAARLGQLHAGLLKQDQPEPVRKGQIS